MRRSSNIVPRQTHGMITLPHYVNEMPLEGRLVRHVRHQYATMTFTFLGTGTSFGVPMIGCRCAVCRSTDPRDNRLRPCVQVSHADVSILVDTPPDLRTQCLAFGVKRVDAVLLTHTHADHIFGLDDLRQFNRLREGAVDVFLAAKDKAFVRRVFAYAFTTKKSSGLTVPQMTLRTDEEFTVGRLRVTAVTVAHGPVDARGYVFEAPSGKRVAYVPDCKAIPDAAAKILRGVNTLIIDGLRLRKAHVSHMLVKDTLKEIERLKPTVAYLTHFSHGIGLHEETQKRLPSHVHLAYDGLEVRIT